MQERSVEPGAPQALAPPVAPSLLARWRDRDHTRGRLLASLAVLSLPAILTMAAGNGLFQLVDLRFLGQLGSNAVAAAGATNQTLRQVFFLAVIGTSVSSQMLIAQSIGEDQLDRAAHLAGQTFVLGVVFSLGAALAGWLFAEPLVSLVARDPDVIALGAVYMRIAFALMVSMTLVQLGSSVLAGAGDTTTPMLVTLLISPVSIAAEWVLAFGKLGAPALGIAGIALGAGIGSLFGAGILLWALASGRCRLHLGWRDLVPDGETLRSIGRYAWQPAFHIIARTLIVVFFMFLAGVLGGAVQAAFTIGLRIEMLAIMAAMSVGNACATLVGQNLGAGQPERAWRTVWVGFGAIAALLWPLALGLFLSRHGLVALFATDPEVQRIASEFLGFSAALMLFYGFYFIAFRTLQASGDMNAPMLIAIGSAVLVGAPLGWVLATRTGLGATGMWVAYLAYVLTNTCLCVTYLFKRGFRRTYRPVPARR